MATKPTTKTDVHAELVKATKITAKKGEEQTAYLERLIEGASKLSDDAFGKLSAATQDYFNKAAEAINDGKDIPVPAGLTAAEPAKAPAKAPAKPAAKAPAKAPAKPAAKAPAKAAAKAPAKAPAKPAKPAAEKPAAKTREQGVAHQVRVLVVKKPTITFEAVAEKIGVEPKIGGHAWNIYNEAVRVMEIVNQQAG